MILDELVALLAFDVDDKNLKAFNDKIGDGMKLVAGFSATVIGAGAALFAIAKTTADAGDNAAKMAQKYGLSAQAYQEMVYSARGDSEALDASLMSLSKAQNGVLEGNEDAIKTFQKLGISVKDANGKITPTDEILMKLSDRFKDMPDGPEKVALAMDTLGKSGVELIPFLNQGSAAIANMRGEANELGFVLGEKAIQDSQAFQDVLDDTKNMLTGIRNSIGAGLIPIITKVAERVKDFIKVNRVLIASRLEKFFAIVADYAEKGYFILTQLIDAGIGLTEVFGGLENVLKLAAAAMLIFASAKILFTIGSMIQLVQGLGTAFTLLNAKALLIPILIGAAVVALGLIIEDIVAFFQGKDSVTGVIVEKFQAMFASLEEGFEGFGSFAKTAIFAILTPVRILINAFNTIVDLISVIRGKMAFGDLAKKMGGRFLNNFGADGDKSLKGALGLGKSSDPKKAEIEAEKGIDIAKAGVSLEKGPDLAKVGIGLANLSNSPTASGAAKIQPVQSDFVSANNSQQNKIEMPITVNVGEGKDPFSIGKEVSSQTSQGLDGVLRGTKRSFSGARSAQ